MAKKAEQSAAEIAKQHIKNNTPSQAYLFYGEEIFLKNMYIPKIKALGYDGSFPDFNDIRITADNTIDEIDALFESYPVMSDKKFIYVKDSGIFKSGKSADSVQSAKTEFWVEKLKNIPDFLFIIFDEKDVDARSAAYKAVAKAGTILQFNYWDEHETLAWVQRGFSKAGKKIDKSVAEYFLSVCNKGLGEISNEMNKLINYCPTEVLKSDIDNVVSKSLDVQVFSITDYIIAGNVKGAVSVLSDFKAQNMKPIEIFFLIFGAFDKMLHTMLMLKNGATYDMVSSKIFPKNQPSKMTFLIKKYAHGAQMLGEKFLTKQVIDAAEINLNIRQGNIDDWTALEQYVTECIYANNSKKNVKKY